MTKKQSNLGGALVPPPLILFAVDPGINGVITVLNNGRLGRQKDIIFITSRLSNKNKKGNKKTRTFDINKLYHNLLETIDHYSNINKYSSFKAVCEAMHPNQSPLVSFTMGRGMMLIESLFSILDVELVFVRPAVWKKNFGLIKTKNNDDSIQYLKKNGFDFSGFTNNQERNRGIADSLLIGLHYLQTRSKLK